MNYAVWPFEEWNLAEVLQAAFYRLCPWDKIILFSATTCKKTLLVDFLTGVDNAVGAEGEETVSVAKSVRVCVF